MMRTMHKMLGALALGLAVCAALLCAQPGPAAADDYSYPLVTLENGGTYCGPVQFSLSEYGTGREVWINNNKVRSDMSVYTLYPANYQQWVVAKSADGTKTLNVKITVNRGHTPGVDDYDCTTPVMCTVCGQVAVAAQEHDFMSRWLADDGGHYHGCYNTGCLVEGSYGPHISNGTATCTSPSTCTACGYETQPINPENHTGTYVWTITSDTHKAVWSCCGAEAVAEAYHTYDDDHHCEICDKIETFSVFLNPRSGVFVGRNVTEYTYGVGATLPTGDDIHRAGYAFEGWYENDDYLGEPVTAITETDTGNKAFYAKWRDIGGPSIKLVDGKTYCGPVEFTVDDETFHMPTGYDELTVTVNGVEIQPQGQYGTYTLSPAQGEQQVTARDLAGNSASVTVVVNDGHTPEADDGDCTTEVRCGVCGEVVTPALEHDFAGAWIADEGGHWHACQNGGCTKTDGKAEHTFAWVVDKEATATEAGSKHEECTTCGYRREAVETPATGTPAQPENPTKPATKVETETPKSAIAQTGDESANAATPLALLGTAALAAGAVLASKRRTA